MVGRTHIIIKLYPAVDREGGTKLGIGVDSNQNGLQPGKVLTSMLKRVDVAVLDMITRNRAGTFPGGRATMYGVAQGGVGIGRIAPSARRFRFAVNAAIRDLTSGAVR